MAIELIKVPDIGEGVAEVEVVEWNVSIGDHVSEDELIASVMTDKAAVEIPSPSNGVIVWLAGKIGDVLAVGADFVKIETDKSADIDAVVAASSSNTEATVQKPAADTASNPDVTIPAIATADAEPDRHEGHSSAEVASAPTASAPQRKTAAGSVSRPLASPAVRKRAREAGIDLTHVAGSGPAGRISAIDLDSHQQSQQSARQTKGRVDSVERIELIGLRRRIAQRMQQSKQRIPHFSYVEEVDVTTLMELRAELNENRQQQQVKLSILPFVMTALVKALAEFPQINARYNDEEGYLERFGGIHFGIATQTPNGLVVPVLAHAESRDIWDNAKELVRVADAARGGNLKREEMGGSTITITSLGAMGGIVTTPVINYPEVAIIGINKIMTRPLWIDDAFAPRQLMNLSSSFDHRIVDGWDAASFIQRVKSLLEFPATMFMER